MRMVIIEGPDGAGKSTLASELIQKHGFEYWHAEVPPKGQNVFEHYTEVVLNAVARGKDIVFDRLPLCQPIYADVMRGGKRQGWGVQSDILIHRLLNAHAARFVVCLPPLKNVIENWSSKRRDRWDPEKRTGDYVDAESKIIAIYDAYEKATKFSYHRYNYTKCEHHFTETLNHCLYESVMFPPLPVGVLGSRFAKYLIVGEQVNGVKWGDFPFYSMKEPSRYLNSCLGQAGFAERDIAFVNAVHKSGVVKDKHRHRRHHTNPRDLKSVIKSLPFFEKAIALGATARRVCFDQDINHDWVDHPSFRLRFKHSRTLDYILDLQRVRKPL